MKRLLTVLFFLLLVPSAEAGYLGAASEHWGEPLPAGTEVVPINDGKTWGGGGMAYAFSLPDAGVYRIYLHEPFWSEAMDKLWRCKVITHEAGHLLGYDHNTDPASIMYGGWTTWSQSVPACNRLVEQKWARWRSRHPNARRAKRQSKRLLYFGWDQASGRNSQLGR